MLSGLLLGARWAGEWAVSRYDRTRNLTPAAPLAAPSAAAVTLHASLRVADLHADSLLWPRDPARRHVSGHVDLPRLLEGRVGLQVFAAVTKTPHGLNYTRNTGDSDLLTWLVVGSGWPPSAWRDLAGRALHQARRLVELVSASGGELVLIRSAGDLQGLQADWEAGAQRVGALLALEGGHALEGRIENLDRLFAAGYRMLGLAHFFDNEIAGSAHGAEQYGLTPFGRQVLARARELGMVIDLSHASPAAIDEVLGSSPVPVVFSHSGVAARCARHGRNVDDATLRRLAANGGVIGIGLWEGATCGDDLEAFLRTLDHAVAVAGIDHVGLGSDFDGSVATPIDASGWIHVTGGLLQRGYSEADIRQIMAGNVLRVLGLSLPGDGRAQPDRTGS